MNRPLGPAAGVVFLVLVLAAGASAQSPHLEHTYKLDDARAQPAAVLEDVRWLTGSWTGTAFGGTFEEVWNPPSAGTMLGMFKVLKDDQVEFYEILLIAEEQGSLNIKVKHFSREFVAWEDKADFVTFPLVMVEENAVHFSGLSFYRINDDEIHVYLVLHNDDRVWEEQLIYRRSER